MMVVGKVISAAGSNNVEIMAATGPYLPRFYKCTKELVVGIVHLIYTENGFQATLVKGFVVGNQRQSFNLRLYPPPHIGKDRGILGIGGCQSMHPATPEVVILRLWLYERIELIHLFAILVRSLLAVSKSIAAKSCIFNTLFFSI